MQSIVMLILGCIIGYVLCGIKMIKSFGKRIEKMHLQERKNYTLYLMGIRWIKNILTGKKIENCLLEKGYQNIAIYGMHYLGDCLVDELKGSGVLVKYGIDMNAERIYREDLEIYKLQSDLEKVDAVIVTAVTDYEKLEEEIRDKMGSEIPVILLEDLLFLKSL